MSGTYKELREQTLRSGATCIRTGRPKTQQLGRLILVTPKPDQLDELVEMGAEKEEVCVWGRSNRTALRKW